MSRHDLANEFRSEILLSGGLLLPIADDPLIGMLVNKKPLPSKEELELAIEDAKSLDEFRQLVNKV